MELARGSISDRPWGLTLGALGTRGFTGELTLASNKGKFSIRFVDGAVVDATSPVASDTALRIAVGARIVPARLVADLEYQISLRVEGGDPGEDDVGLVGDLAGLAPEQLDALRRRVIAQRAARTFTADRGEFVLSVVEGLSAVPHPAAIDVHAVIYLGARVYLCQQRLAEELAQYGSRFVFTATVNDALPRFGLTELEGPILDGIRAGAKLDVLESLHRDPRTVHALVYALLACMACAPAPVEAVQVVPPRPVAMTPRPRTLTPNTLPGTGAALRTARGTPTAGYVTQPGRAAAGSDSGFARARSNSTTPPPRARRDSSESAPPQLSAEDRVALAGNAFRRGQLALEDDSLERALGELARAVELAPNDLHYQATLAWARFRAASNKEAVADATRQVLGRAILKSPAPEVARFFLGRVERILGRDREALRHFSEVLQLQPEHREAASEVRVLEARLARR